MIRDCQKVRIETLNGNEICEASVEDIGQDYILLTIPEQSFPFMPSQVNIILYDNIEGLVTYPGILIPPGSGIIGTQKQISLNNRLPNTLLYQLKEKTAVIQRRADIKIKREFPANLRLLSGHIVNNGENRIVSGKTIPILICDISAGGIGFTCSRDFQVGQYFSFIFDQGRKPVETEGKIVWSGPVSSNNGTVNRWRYGAQFLYLSATAEAVLRSYVFSEQIKELSNEKSDIKSNPG